MADCYAEVHDGKFRKEITALWTQGKAIADGARKYERLSHGHDYESWDKAFAEWRKIIPVADTFVKLLTDETVIRAKKKTRRQKVVSFLMWLISIIISILVSAFF